MEKSTITVKSKPLSLPLLVLYTHSGSIPFLSWNFVRKYNGILFRSEQDMVDEINMVKLNVADFYDYLESNDHDHHLSKLKYFENCSFLMSLFDPLQFCYLYKSTDDQIAIHTYHGKKMLSVDDMLKLCRSIGVEHVQAIADIITPPNAGRKWLNKSVNRSSKFLDDTINQYISDDDNSSGQSIKIWATLTGGYQSESRVRACQQISVHADKLQAIIIDGFFGYIKTDEENFKYYHDILCRDVLQNLPANIPKALFGILYPDTMIKLIKCGIDIFDSSICTFLTNRGRALPSPLICENTMKLLFDRSITITTTTIDSDIIINNPNPSIIIDLNNFTFKDNNLLLSNKCQCYTCQMGFTRGYINHLLKRKEINANILLQIHNHYVLTKFFHQLKRIIQTGNFDQLLANSHINVDNSTQCYKSQPPSMNGIN